AKTPRPRDRSHFACRALLLNVLSNPVDTTPVTTATEFDPVAERLLTEGRERMHEGLHGREMVTRWLFAIAFLAVAGPMAAFAPSTRNEPWFVAVILVGSFAVASRIEFEIGSGTTLPTELILVPMLFLLPAGEVPLLVVLGLVLAHVPDLVRGAFPLQR